ncbi:hypothetical protein [Burkholderia ubonensis]|uniref:hypothetical protein n=1 Tax=Burkholderia ubonensis TaxID=101571 RepID=UPI00075F42E2|nr:hypothetical protein [Burkholderia ubonensis]KVN30526.1 hypothetical protein WJ64_12535 [Burkholderia ubonensis]
MLSATSRIPNDEAGASVDRELRPVDAEGDSDATLLSVVLRSVDSELIPAEVAVDSDAVEPFSDERSVNAEVDSDTTVLLTAPVSAPDDLSSLDPAFRFDMGSLLAGK